MKVLFGNRRFHVFEIIVQAVVKQLRCEASEILVLHVLQPIAAETVPEMSANYAPELEGEKDPDHVTV